jgi:hypothetical protein
MKLTILPNANPYWSRIATLLGNEQGEVSGSYETAGKKFHSAVFAIYGGEFSWIPAEFCKVVETPAE